MKSQTTPSQSSSPYHYAVTRVAVAQICRSIGFKSVQNSALSVITDVAGKYLQAIASAAVSAANAAGRTDSNIVDIVAALEYLCSNTGFSGGSDVNLGFCSSGPLIDVMKFVKYNDEIPFAKPLRRECLGEKISFSGFRKCVSGRSYVPKWLPFMPEIRKMEVKRRELWPCFDDHDDGKLGVVVEGKSGGNAKRTVLPVKRGKVKFKIKKGGKGFKGGLRNSGKRVLRESWSQNQECSGDNKKIVSYYVRRKKSDTASVIIPEVELEMASGTLGGLVTTVEGLITKISESLERVHGFSFGDGLDDNRKTKWQDLGTKLMKLTSV